jgi:ribosome-binding factor A
MSQRVARAQESVKEVLGETIQKLKDPRIGFVTVTAVRLSADLRHARVFVSSYGTPEEQEQSIEGLRSARPYLQSEVGRQVRMRYTPELSIELDDVPQKAERVEDLLRRIAREEDGR